MAVRAATGTLILVHAAYRRVFTAVTSRSIFCCSVRGSNVHSGGSRTVLAGTGITAAYPADT